MKWLLPFLRIWSKDVMLQASSEGKMMIEKKRETALHYICFVWKDLETG